MPSATHRSETSTFFRLQREESWAGKKKPTTADALWLKRRWADTRPSSVLAYGRAAALVSRLKQLSAWPSSTACLTREARTPSADSTLLRNPSGAWENSAEIRSMQQRHFNPGLAGTTERLQVSM